MWGVWRIMMNQKNKGFTLIELLAVIAIIGILAALVTVGAPRVLEKARIADVQSDFNNIRNALATYYADFGSYPPGYGYRRLTNDQVEAEDIDGDGTPEGVDPYQVPYDTSIADARYFYLDNYMVSVGMFKSFDLYDRFNIDSHDANRDDKIQFMEYRPVGKPDPANPLQFIGFSLERYRGNAVNNQGETNRMEVEQGPYIYIAVNALQAKRFLQYCMAGYAETGNLDYAFGRIFDFEDPLVPAGQTRAIGDRYLGRMEFPPPKYDAFVLISVGPNLNVSGLLPTPLPGQHPSDILDAYHILGLRAYFLATRDINLNDRLDFDFRARTRQNENSSAFDEPGLGLMPDGSGEEGPLIYVQGG